MKSLAQHVSVRQLDPVAMKWRAQVARQIVGVFHDVRNQGPPQTDVPEIDVPFWQAPGPIGTAQSVYRRPEVRATVLHEDREAAPSVEHPAAHTAPDSPCDEKTPGVTGTKAGAHAFRRFRLTWLRENAVPKDLEHFWMGHADEEIGDIYSQLETNVKFRKEVLNGSAWASSFRPKTLLLD